MCGKVLEEEEELSLREIVVRKRKRIREREVKFARRRAMHRLKLIFGEDFLFDKEGTPNKENLLCFSRGKYLRSLRLTSFKLA